MADAKSIGFYKSLNSIGGPISTKLTSGNHNNFFTNLSQIKQASGADQYRCGYIKNIDALQETLESVTLWLSKQSGGNNADTRIKWGIDKTQRYNRAPYQSFNGTSDFIDVTDTPALDLNQFTLSCWIRTSADYSPTGRNALGMIASKGGTGSATSGENMNYGIYINTGNKIDAGFEETNDTKHLATSTNAVNDGLWHWVCVTYDSINVRLYVDGSAQTPHATTATPETNAKPFTMGKNSRANDRYFLGDIDEVRVFNRAQTEQEITDYWTDGTITKDGRVYQNKFGDDNGSRVAQIVADIYTAPTGIVWNDLEASKPIVPNIGTMKYNCEIPIWFWWQSDTNIPSREDDTALFNFSLKITSGGTGSGGGGDDSGGTGGGTGGNPPPAVTDFQLVEVSDSDCGGTFDNYLEYVMALSPAPVAYLHAGDNTSNGFSCMKSNYDDAGIKSKVILALGNHDTSEDGSNTKSNDIMSYQGVNNRWHGHTVGNIRIIVLCNTTDTSFSKTGPQAIFLEKELKDARANPLIKWIFVVHHKPGYTGSSDHPSNEGGFMQTFGPLFNTYGVDLVFSGHNHQIQVTKQIKYNPSSPSSPIVVDSGGNYEGGLGWVQIMNATGGQESGLDNASSATFTAYVNSNTRAAAVIKLSNTGLTLTGEIHKLDGTVLNSFIITRT